MAGVKGRSGPRAKPDAIHNLQGTARKDRHRNRPKAPATDGIPIPKCMKLTAAEKRVWAEVVEMLSTVTGLAADIDAIGIACLCEAVTEFNQARAEIKKDGATCVSDKGGSYQHPAVGRKNKALERIRYLMARFCMTPSDRASVDVAPPTTPRPAGAGGGRFAAFIEAQMGSAGSN